MKSYIEPKCEIMIFENVSVICASSFVYDKWGDN